MDVSPLEMWLQIPAKTAAVYTRTHTSKQILINKLQHYTSQHIMAAKFYELRPKDKTGEDYPLSEMEGKVVLIVNVASKCGFTPQYKELEALYKAHKDKGLVILGFPCNQFGHQEPGTDEDITQFCQLNYGVTFPIMKKIDVNGSNEDPVYNFLKSQKSGILGFKGIKWNFEKFLVDKSGSVYERYSSLTKPSSIEADIEKLLK